MSLLGVETIGVSFNLSWRSFSHLYIDTWGAADVQAAVAAVTLWIENIGWEGPPVALNDWILTGHSNGGSNCLHSFEVSF